MNRCSIFQNPAISFRTMKEVTCYLNGQGGVGGSNIDGAGCPNGLGGVGYPNRLGGGVGCPNRLGGGVGCPNRLGRVNGPNIGGFSRFFMRASI